MAWGKKYVPKLPATILLKVELTADIMMVDHIENWPPLRVMSKLGQFGQVIGYKPVMYIAKSRWADDKSKTVFNWKPGEIGWLLTEHKLTFPKLNDWLNMKIDSFEIPYSSFSPIESIPDVVQLSPNKLSKTEDDLGELETLAIKFYDILER